MILVNVCPRCTAQTAWDNYHRETVCVTCGYSGNGELPQVGKSDDTYGKNEMFPLRFKFALYTPVFEWSDQPKFEKWEFECVIRYPSAHHKDADYVIEAIIPVQWGLWPFEVVNLFKYGKRVRRRVLYVFRDAITKSIETILESDRVRIRGLEAVVHQSIYFGLIDEPELIEEEPETNMAG